MNKLTNEEIAKVFLSYGLKAECRITNGNPNQVLFTKEFSTKNLTVSSKDSLRNFAGGYNCGYNQVLLALTPLNKITDEHKDVLGKIYGGIRGRIDDNFFQAIDSDGYVTHYTVITKELPARMFQQFILWGYAVPLYFGPNHWANGKTAIQLNIATDKTLQYGV